MESEAEELPELLVVGSRAGGRTKIDSPVPVDVFDVTKTSKTQPQANINQILNSIAPSFTSTTQVVSDGSDHLDPAQLRGLGLTKLWYFSTESADILLPLSMSMGLQGEAL